MALRGLVDLIPLKSDMSYYIMIYRDLSGHSFYVRFVVKSLISSGGFRYVGTIDKKKDPTGVGPYLRI